MTVYIVTLAVDNGKIVGVFSEQSKAADYIAKHPYNGYILTEAVVDNPEG